MVRLKIDKMLLLIFIKFYEKRYKKLCKKYPDDDIEKKLCNVMILRAKERYRKITYKKETDKNA